MSSWREGDITANGLRLHYIRTGSGDRPALLLLHGLTDNGRYWSPTAAALEDRFDIVMLDQRGHGASAQPAQGYSPEEMAEDAAAVIRALGLMPTSVLGHSMGGAVAIVLAARHPELVARVLLLDPALGPATPDAHAEAQHRQRMEQWRADVLAYQRLSLDALAQQCAARTPAWGREDCAYWAASNLQVYPDAVTQFRVLDSWRDLLPRIAAPTLLIHGDRELGSIVDAAWAGEIAHLAPNVRLAHIPGAGHSPQREQFAAYIAAVTEFLRQEPDSIPLGHS